MKILLGGAGGAPTNNVVMSLRESGCEDRLIGMSPVATDLLLAQVDERHIVPYANSDLYPQALLRVIRQSTPDFLHVQHDFEVRAVSRLREQIAESGVALYLPSAETIDKCVDKWATYQSLSVEGVSVPSTILVSDVDDLRRAFEKFNGRVWLRAREGAAGRGALPTSGDLDYEFARLWIERFNGWGGFTAAELLSSHSVTWLSIWYRGELVVAQTRKRKAWSFGDRTLSGVTGVTGVAETWSDELVTRTAMDAVAAVASQPHGIFGVDLTYDEDQEPKVTEINIARFFTTVHFFTKAGVNFPKIYRDIALENKFPVLERKINPLPDGLVWIRGMDVTPVITTADDVQGLQPRADA